MSRVEQWMTALREGRVWLSHVVLCLLGLCLLLLTRQFVVEQDHFVIGFSGCSGWSAWVYLAAVIVVLTQPTNRATMWIVLGFAVAFRLMTVFTDPFLSSDVYRYVWDGIVQHAHINPYRYVPGDPALQALQVKHADIYESINRKTYARTIYPPVAQMFYWLVTWFSPTVTAMKVALVGMEAVTAGCVVAMLRRMGRPESQVLLFAWCPLLVWEIGGSGHVDALVFGFVALAMLFRAREQPGWTGFFLGLAVMSKFYPLVLLPALWMRRRDARGLARWGEWQLPVALAAVCAGGYAVYLSVGRLVFGFLGGYAKEEGLDSGSRFFLLDWAKRVPGLGGLPEWSFLLLCAVVLGGISWWAWRGTVVDGPETVRRGRAGSGSADARPVHVRAAMLLAFAMMLLFAPHYPWYIAWLIPLLAVAPSLTLMTYVLAFFYGYSTGLADPGPKMFLLNQLIYTAVAVVFVLEMTVLQRWPARRLLRLREVQA